MSSCPNCGKETDGTRCPNCGHKDEAFPTAEFVLFTFVGIPGALMGGCGLYVIGASLIAPQEGWEVITIPAGSLSLLIGGWLFFLTLRKLRRAIRGDR